MRHEAKPRGMGGLPVLDEAEKIRPGDTITETVWGKTYEVVENPSGDDLENLAQSAMLDPEAVCFTIKGHGRDFAYHKPAYWAVDKRHYRTTYLKTEGHP